MIRAFAALAALVATLCLGIYLGGHPADLPGFLQDAFVEDSATLNSEAVNVIEDNFIDKVPNHQLENASLAARLGGEARRYVIDKHAWPAVAARYEALYDEILGDSMARYSATSGAVARSGV